MLNNHAPIVAILQKGVITMKGNNISIDEHVNERFQINQNEVTLAINSGTVEMKNNKVIVLAE